MTKQNMRKAETRKALLEASSRMFKNEGFDGIGVDGIAKAAGATSGAFYAHLKSKNDAFRIALEAGLDEVIETIPDYQKQYGNGWVDAFARYYLSAAHRQDRACGCAMTAMSPDVARADADTRALYDLKMDRIADLIARGLPGENTEDRRKSAWAFLSILIGALTTSRAIADESLAEEVAEATLPVALRAASRHEIN
ncbi:TetR/AcrR family transcriptional regulator [uncultured Roseibium sp.]|uniref:TetR/AcrR family transcriptional regulator n=1 Tax=uncultured Roseibium sp. TaxID=1936171 RepID=UPI00260EC005|nr:TetR/AcrR family transcriptional regulator [uncultured Roseibium sp.]